MSINGMDMNVNEMKLNKVSRNWAEHILEIHVCREGKIIALEMDSQNREETDSIYTHNNTLIESREEVTNKLYIMNDKETLFLLR
jgi:hypothetical protein